MAEHRSNLFRGFKAALANYQTPPLPRNGALTLGLGFFSRCHKAARLSSLRAGGSKEISLE
jgi:hypothetical protein